MRQTRANQSTPSLPHGHPADVEAKVVAGEEAHVFTQENENRPT